MIVAGIDAGSRTIKIVLWEGFRGAMVGAGIADQGVEQDALAGALLDRLLGETGRARSDLGRVVATGYGRNIMSMADSTVTEITCHAVGVGHVLPGARTVIDIGGQDSKLIRLDGDGGVRDFAMNDRCAAGSGRFLEVIAARLGVELSALGALARRSERPAAISSMCVVFAETEIIGLLASRTPPADLAAGVQASMANRVVAMAGRHLDPPIVFTGGVALVPGMSDALATALGHPLQVAPDPRMTGALGAALIAAGHRDPVPARVAPASPW
ncbi:MAG TPA: acyl-CoA dehydratase activase [Phycisphaerae bacterium]|nr:acyl-CoA dehydratase activase [Phycisphaerae bacterium]